MITCEFEDVKTELAKHLREHRLIPIIGSGFSAGSMARNGVVPTGVEMKAYMKEVVSKIQAMDKSTDAFDDKSFIQMATYYHKLQTKDAQKSYIRDNFSNVELPLERSKLLEIDWLYIYTLNMDDAIENCSQYKKVISSNREVDLSVFDNDKCVIKLHGDVTGYLSYDDDYSQIFDYKQYARSLLNNKSMLNKLRHDFTYNNLIFIGCSLDSEFDLATIDMYTERNDKLTSKYYFTVNEPDDLKKIELDEYGITHIVLNRDYVQLYQNLYSAYTEANQIQAYDIDVYRNLAIKQLPNGYKENNSYLFYGKSIVDVEHGEMIFPGFFINRKLGKDVISNLTMNTIHIIYGPRVSGKTYLLASIVQNVRDRDIYFFDSRNSINNRSLQSLLNKEDTVIIFDTNSISKDLIFNLLHQNSLIKNNRNNFIIAVNTSEKDVVSVINNNINNFEILGYPLDSKLSKPETDNINALLPLNELPNFDQNKSILDNLLRVEKIFVKNGRYKRINPYMRTIDDFVVLILFAINEKLYTEDLIKYGVDKECFEQIQKTSPLISEEHTLLFERYLLNSSVRKYVLNAKYWLFESLGQFVQIRDNHTIIIEAYKRIVSTILDTTNRRSYSAAMDYFKFDVINEIFQSDNKGQLGLAKAIYEGLNSLLSSNPHYYHQRAKCYLWQSGYDKSDLDNLDSALRFANIAKSNFEITCRKESNEKITISLAHTKFTIALIASRISTVLNHDALARQNAIFAIYDAIQSPYNKSDFRELKRSRKNKQDDINNVISNALTGNALDKQTSKKLSYIVKQLFEMQN